MQNVADLSPLFLFSRAWKECNNLSKLGTTATIWDSKYTKSGVNMSSLKENTQQQLKLDQQLKEQRRTVDFDTFDIHLQQLLAMVDEGQIWVAPAYQRQFRWDPKRCSQLIESVLLGIPVPSLFMATNPDNSWEVVDGVQRLSSLVKFAGSTATRKKLGVGDALVLTDLQKLTEFEGLRYEDLPANIQLHFRTRPLKVITLNDKSDSVVRYDLFERLNTGGVALTPQEIRDCVYRGDFAERLETLANTADFKTVVKLTQLQQKDGTAEECVLRFFAFLDRYKEFDHGVSSFLNDYMSEASKNFDYKKKEKIFNATFAELAKAFPDGLSRPGRKGTTPLNLYEGITVGAALALRTVDHLVIKNLDLWMASDTLRSFTTGATNDRSAVKGRIEFCRDHFAGKEYVRSPAS
jgi:Protein of unknown function DUF262